ncbi:metallophosphoesterase [Micromonosporaceae bacterium Da 78-11]
MVLIAQFSDIHVDAGERSAERTARVARYLAGLPTPPDVVLVTGDVADHGVEAEYERVRELIDLDVPVLYCPGNHDVRGPYRKALLRAPDGDEGPVNQAYEIAGVLFLMGDSSIPGRDDGLLDDETLRWLDEQLTAHPDLPTFVCFHHPPVVLGLPFPDSIRQFRADRLAAVVARHPQIVALLCGHAHTAAATTFAGRPLLVAPGVVSTSLLPFEGDAVVDHDLPPMLALHLLDQELRLTTHFRVLP